MKKLIDIWFKFGYSVYWIGLFGSIIIWDVSALAGMGIGLLCVVGHLIILQILYWINGDSWIWKT